MKRKVVFEHFLLVTLSALRWLLWIAIGANIAIEIAEVYLQKDVYHLAMSAIFFLLANMQIGISRLLISMKDEDMSRRLLYLSVFMTCAAVIEVIDLGIDSILTEMSSGGLMSLYKLGSVVESFLGAVSMLLAGYSLDQFFVLLKRKVVGLADVSP